MFSLVGIGALLIAVLVTPQEWFPPLHHLATVGGALAIFGYAIDLRLRRLRPDTTPQLAWVVLLIGWGVLALAWIGPGLIPAQLSRLIAPITLYLLIAHGVQSFRALQAVAGLLLVITLFIGTVAAQQGLAPLGCFNVDEAHFTWDDRGCVTQSDCDREEGAVAGADYRCEHVGLFGTQSVGGRVRYAGTLADPDELALAVAVALPFAFAFFQRKRSLQRALVAAAALTLVTGCEILTRSRAGQLALLAVLAVYLVRRFAASGLLLAGLAAIPLWFFAGREAAERLIAPRDQGWAQGLQMFRDSPLFGVGMGQFAEHHLFVARSSLVQAAAELGFVGLLIWSVVIYLSLKIPLAVLRRAEAEVARTWALALLASLAGVVAGMFFFSFLYQELLWIYVGLSGALYSATRTHAPDFEVRLGWGELAAIAASDGALLLLLMLTTALRS